MNLLLNINNTSQAVSSGSASVGIVLLLVLSTSSLADTPLNEILVTADFRDATVLATPASLTVLNKKIIDRRQAVHLEQLLNVAPNVNFSSGASRGRFIQIRGIGERSQFIEPLNPSVGILVDGIDFTGIAGAATTMDLQQVEILRGPQGTLYGANALAGLISLKANQPTGETRGKVGLGMGRFNTQTVSAAIGGALSPTVNYRLAAQSHSSDGYVVNDFLARDDTDDIDERSLRAIFTWQMSDRLATKLTLFHADADNGYDAFSLDNTRHTLSDKPGHDRQKSAAVAVETTWRINDAYKWVALISFADSDLEYGYDEDWAFPNICAGQACDGWEYNSEDNYVRDRDNGSIDLRWVSQRPVQVLGQSADWVFGVYARNQEEQLLRQYTYLAADFRSDFETENRAVYGQLDTHLSDALTLLTGVRFERRSADYGDSDAVRHGVDENLWGGRVALQYQMLPRTMLYSLISRGYKAGGVNSDSSLAPADREFDTELMWNFEAGIKGSWLDGRLQVQLAGFYQQRRDIQIKQSLVQSREDSNASDFTDYFGNSAKGSNLGIEIEALWAQGEHLNFFANLGWLDTEYDMPLSEALDSRQQAHAPRYQFAVGGQLHLSEHLSASVDVEGKDKFYLSSSHHEQSQSYQLINANLVYAASAWQLSVWARNLTDEEVIVRGFGGFGNDPRKYYQIEPYYQMGEPRTFGVSGQYAF